MSNASIVLTQTDQHQEAIECLNEARQYQAELVEAYPEIISYRNATARTFSQLGYAYKVTGKDSLAIENYLQSIEYQRQLVKQEPAISEHRMGLAISLNTLGNLYDQKGDRGKGFELLSEGVTTLNDLVEHNPDVDRYRLHLGKTSNNLGNVFLNQGKLEEARQYYTTAEKAFEILTGKGAMQRQSLQELSKSLNNLAVIELRSRNFDEALALLKKCRNHRVELTEKFPEIQEYRSDLSKVLYNLMAVNFSLGQMDEALRWGRESLDIAAATASAFPQVETYQFTLANTFSSLAGLASETRKDQLAIEYFNRANEEFKVLTEKFSQRPRHYGIWGTCLNNLALLHWYRGELTEAQSASISGTAKVDIALKQAPDELRLLNQNLTNQLTLARIEIDLEPDSALKTLDDVIEAAGNLLEKHPKSNDLIVTFSDALAIRSRLSMKQGELDPAIADLEKAAKLASNKRLNLEVRIEILKLRKNLRESLTEFEGDRKLPDSEKEQFALAQELACDRNRNYELAIQCFQKLIEGDFKNVAGADVDLAWVESAECALKLGVQAPSGSALQLRWFKKARTILGLRLELFKDDSKDSSAEAGIWLRTRQLAEGRKAPENESLSQEERDAWKAFWAEVRSHSRLAENQTESL